MCPEHTHGAPLSFNLGIRWHRVVRFTTLLPDTWGNCPRHTLNRRLVWHNGRSGRLKAEENFLSLSVTELGLLDSPTPTLITTPTEISRLVSINTIKLLLNSDIKCPNTKIIFHTAVKWNGWRHYKWQRTEPWDVWKKLRYNPRHISLHSWRRKNLFWH